MSNHSRRCALALGLAVLGTACHPDVDGPGATGRRPEVGSTGPQPLATPCTIASGVVTVSLLANEQATLTLDGSSRLVVNGVICSTATVSTISRINVSTADPTQVTDEQVIIDGTNGLFGAGTASGVGFSIALGLGSGDAVEVVGTPGDDVLIAGRSATDTWVTFNHDVYKDLTLTGVEALTLTGGAGDDTLTGASLVPAWVRSSYFSTGLPTQLPLTLQGGVGADTLVGGDGPDALWGGDGPDTLVGSLGSDVENGELGDDVFDEGAAPNGADVFNGGGGIDTVSYGARTASVSVSVGSGANDGAGGEGDDVRSDVEVVVGGSAADSLSCEASTGCTLHGGLGNDTLLGRNGADTLLGEGGDDLLQPGPGNDIVNGGPGIDTVTYVDATHPVTVTLGTPGTPTTGNGAPAVSENDSLDEVENIIGSDYGDSLTGNALANRLTGGFGNDTLVGGDGDDTFDEGSSSNGADVINGGLGEDRVDYSARVSPLIITLDDVANDGQAGENDDIGSDVEDVTGGDNDDDITGSSADNKLDGMGGADALRGLGGTDELTGGSGSDILEGGDGDDILDQGADGATCDCGNGFDIAICDVSATNCEVR